MTSAVLDSLGPTQRLVIYTKYAALAVALYWILLWMGVL